MSVWVRIRNLICPSSFFSPPPAHTVNTIAVVCVLLVESCIEVAVLTIRRADGDGKRSLPHVPRADFQIDERKMRWAHFLGAEGWAQFSISPSKVSPGNVFGGKFTDTQGKRAWQIFLCSALFPRGIRSSF